MPIFVDVITSNSKIISTEGTEFEISCERMENDKPEYFIYDSNSGECIGCFDSKDDMIEFFQACINAIKELDV